MPLYLPKSKADSLTAVFPIRLLCAATKVRFSNTVSAKWGSAHRVGDWPTGSRPTKNAHPRPLRPGAFSRTRPSTAAHEAEIDSCRPWRGNQRRSNPNRHVERFEPPLDPG